MSLSKNQWYLLVFGVVFIAIAGFFMREAKNEIYYLCGNFKPGTPKIIVEQQLATAELSRVSEVHARQIKMQSVFHAYLYTCTIDFDFDRKVTEVRIS